MLTKRLKECRKSGDLSDLTAEVGKHVFRLHKLVMALSSEYFNCLVRSEMADSNHVSLLELPGGEQSMDLVADYCYDIPIRLKLTVDNIGHMVCASHYLQIQSLQKYCLEVLADFVKKSLSNCCRILSNCKDVEPTAKETGVIDCCVKYLNQFWIGPMQFVKPKGSLPVNTSVIVQSWAKELRHVPVPLIVTIIEKQSTDFLAKFKSNEQYSELPVELTDQLLNLQSPEYCLSPSDFLSLYNASSSIPRTSYDAVFQALEKLIKTYGDTMASRTMIQEIDFSKLSLEALERASDNICISQPVVMKATLSICNDQRKQLETSQQLNNSLQQQLKELEACHTTLQQQSDVSKKNLEDQLEYWKTLYHRQLAQSDLFKEKGNYPRNYKN